MGEVVGGFKAEPTMINTCQCAEDGYCPRYQRIMRGRMRELCAGINCDAGTAAAFRAQWAREAEGKAQIAHMPSALLQGEGGGTQKLLLQTGQAPGDAVAMTAAVYSLHRAHPGKYETAVESYWPEVFAHNPDVVFHRLPTRDGRTPSGYKPLAMHYPAVRDSNTRAIHFMQGWCEHLGSALGIGVPLVTDRPRLYFDHAPYGVDDYWLICSGGKNDFTNKLWGRARYQEVVNLLRGNVRFVQVGGARPPVPWHPSTKGSQEDSHPPLQGVDNLVGKTSLRELFELMARARGVLCGVSLLMHVAAALQRPSVIIAGGREPQAWNAYPMQHYLHTIGMLGCTDSYGTPGVACWRNRVLPQGDNPALDANPCLRPQGGVPACMAMIEPKRVAELVRWVDKGGS